MLRQNGEIWHFVRKRLGLLFDHRRGRQAPNWALHSAPALKIPVFELIFRSGLQTPVVPFAIVWAAVTVPWFFFEAIVQAEIMADAVLPTLENKEDTILSTLENKEDVSSSTLENTEDTILPILENKEDAILPTLENKEDAILPTLENTEDTILPILENKEDAILPTLENKEDTILPTLKS